ncbi:MAG: DUF4423 domain-containing protein, partial [Pseudomonadota bacterium]
FETLRSAHTNHPTLEVPIRGACELESEVESWDLPDSATMRILRNWYYLPVLEFTSLKRFDGTAADIAQGLGLALESVEVALKELRDFGLVEKKVDGLWRKTSKKLRWSSSVPSQEIGQFHKNMMEKAKDHLSSKKQSDYEKRLITGVTLTVSPSKVNYAKSRINEFLHQLSNDLIEEDDPNAQVYHLASQFFPVSHDDQD